MLVISNGAMKSGSTWLTSILLKMVDHQPIPEKYRDERFDTVPTIKADRIREFLKEVDYSTADYVSKNHFYYERALLSKYKNVYVFDITRDLADTLVSLYFHTRKKMNEWSVSNAALDDIKKGYWLYGREFVRHLARYHAIWGRPSSWTYVSSYERLKTKPRAEIAAMGRFIGVRLTKQKIESIIEETSFEKLSSAPLPANSGMEVRFRKGVVGDHANYFDAEIIDDIRRIEAENTDFPRRLIDRLDYAFKAYRYSGRNYPAPHEPKSARPARTLKALKERRA